MERFFVDSNVFLRYYNKDDPKQRAAAASVFLKAKKGQIELFCSPPVFFEVAWVLRSRYKIPAAAILDALEAMFAIPNLSVFDGEYVRRAISWAREKQQSFPDAYISVVANDKNIGVVSFNAKHFKKSGIPLYPIE
jgi:predicted nucleic acid-binding protein